MEWVARSIWLNCALRGDEAVVCVSIGQQWLVLSQYEATTERLKVHNNGILKKLTLFIDQKFSC